jgi:hypothetical protein
MKKIFTLAILSVCLLSCTNDDEPDCNCDRVVEVTQFTIPGQTFGGYKTVNDCSGETRTYQYTGTPPREGSCK